MFDIFFLIENLNKLLHPETEEIILWCTFMSCYLLREHFVYSCVK